MTQDFFLYICLMKEKELAIITGFDINQFVAGQSVDCVIFGFKECELKILVLKWKITGSFWALPGGFIYKDEDMDKAAIRVLKERTGVDLPFLEQYKTFGDNSRRDDDTVSKNLKSIKIEGKIADWFQERFISTGYLSLVDIDQCKLSPDFASEKIEWISIDKLPDLIFDHSQMVSSALAFIRNQINYLPIGINLLPKKFTMKELQCLYEAILTKPLDRGNFQRKMLKLGIFIRHEKQLEGGAHKAPYLYSFDEEKYNDLLERGFGFNS